MNKYEKAFKIATTIVGYSTEEVNEAKITLQELVDKETPMKPIVNKLPYEVHDGEIVTKYYECNCPKCNVVLTKKWGHVYIRADKYCPNCGQKLDWSD